MNRLSLLVAFAVMACLAPLMASDSQATDHNRRIMTWVPPYAMGMCEQRLNDSYGGVGIKDGITHLGLQFWTPTAQGAIKYVSQFKQIDDSEVIKFRRWGRDHGVRIMLCVYNGASGWDWELASAAFDTHQSEFIESLVSETLRLDLDGVDIDLEGNGDLNDSKEAFLRFIRKLSARLHKEGKELSVNTFAYKWHAPNQTWWADLLPYIDGLNVMGYSETGADAKGWRSYRHLTSAAGNHASKLLIGMPGNHAEWQGSGLMKHLQWVTGHEIGGLTIWDAQLKDPAWRTETTWQTIEKIRLTQAPNYGERKAPATAPKTASKTELQSAIKQLAPLHEKISPPGPGDWLAQHREPGQTFAQYLASNPVTPQGKRNTIYIQPIGKFSETQRRILTLTAEYMALYFGVPVKTNETIPLSSIPAKAQRTHPEWGDKQILTTYVLYDLLYPKLPGDAAAVLAFTASDLWPGKGWNFVFGQASLRKRVAVWSIYRNGNPDAGKRGFSLCLKRTIKTATHETAHMFSMLHCTAYECGMCGSNHREESDRRPTYLCPECMAKVCWTTQIDPVERYKKLLGFYEKNGFMTEAEFTRKSIRKLENQK